MTESGGGTAGMAQRCWSCSGNHLTQGRVIWLSLLLSWPPALLSPHVTCPLWRIHPAFGVSWQLCQIFYYDFFSFTLRLNPVSWEIWAEPKRR